jgi:hypothetical protein
MKVICPFCDSDKVETIEVSETFVIPFSEDAVINHKIYRCHNCEEEGDFENSLEKTLTAEIEKANRASAPKIMDELAQNGITMTYLEKALRLPFRTTSRWKSKRISHAGLALLRLVRFSPSLLEAADDNFSPEAVAKYQISRTWDFFKDNTSNPSFAMFAEGNQFGLGFAGDISSSSSTPSFENMQWELVKW